MMILEMWSGLGKLVLREDPVQTFLVSLALAREKMLVA
jgi:hypothetical protein